MTDEMSAKENNALTYFENTIKYCINYLTLI